MSGQLHCWKCGERLVDVILPLSRREECADCGADQHSCRMCVHYQPAVADACNEDRAEAVTDKERANFCDYFSPSNHAFKGRQVSDETKARQQLAALFGDESGADVEALEDSSHRAPEADSALAALEKLFAKD